MDEMTPSEAKSVKLTYSEHKLRLLSAGFSEEEAKKRATELVLAEVDATDQHRAYEDLTGKRKRRS